MRGVLILGLAALVLGLCGWISFDSDPARSSINLETEKIEADVTQAKKSAENLLKAKNSTTAESKAETFAP